MFYLKITQAAAKAVLVLSLSTAIAAPMSLEEFNKMPSDEQGSYVSAAVAMASYIAAAEGDVERAGCIQRWFFGVNGEVGRGPEAIATEVTIAERLNPKKFHIEGIALGAISRECAPAALSHQNPRAAAKP